MCVACACCVCVLCLCAFLCLSLTPPPPSNSLSPLSLLWSPDLSVFPRLPLSPALFNSCQHSHSMPEPLSSLSLLLRSQENQLRAQQWMQKLLDQLVLQHFLRDCHEVGPPAVLGTIEKGLIPDGWRDWNAPSKWVEEHCSLYATRRR